MNILKNKKKLPESSQSETVLGQYIRNSKEGQPGENSARQPDGLAANVKAGIKGMHCAACSSRIEKVVGAMEGIYGVSVNLATEVADISWNSDVVSIEEISDQIKGLGFELILPGFEKEIHVVIDGMHCAACSSRIEKVVGAMEGVESCQVNLATGEAKIVFNQDKVNQRELREKIEGLGFKVSSASTASLSMKGRHEEIAIKLRNMRRNLVPAFILAFLVIVVSMGEMVGISMPAIINPVLHPFNYAFFQFVLVLPVLYLGRHFYLIGFPALWRGVPNMDSLIAVGTGAAFVYSSWNLVEIMFGINAVARAHDLYFESAAMLIALVSLGKFLETRSKLRASHAITQLMQLAPDRATLIKGYQQEEILVDEIVAGDLLLIRPGERLPIDGTVEKGESAVDESMLTGESLPVNKGPGDTVIGGTLNKNGSLHVRATKVGADTTLSRIIKLVENAQGTKAPIANLADRISLYFVPTVMVIATVAGVSWYFIGEAEFTFALRIFIAVMVIACPCAMGLATPTSIMVGTGRGAQLGVLVKNGSALEIAENIQAVVFDKTGTLTYGKPALTDFINYSKLEDDALLTLIAGAEGASEHTLADAVVVAVRDKGLLPADSLTFTALPGRGILSTIKNPFLENSSVSEVLIGNHQLMTEKSIAVSETCKKEAERLSGEGKTVLFVALDGSFSALLAISDQIKKESAETVRQLKTMGIDVVMLTGDNEGTARSIAEQAGISKVIAQVLPENKALEIEKIQQGGKVVAMVGDGINDAPALATADLGIAMGTGIDVAIESGDIVLMTGDLINVLTTLQLSRATMRNIRQNLFWALAYNVVGIPVAAGVLYIFGGPVLNPMIAGGAMALSSVSVVTNALRLRYFIPKRP